MFTLDASHGDRAALKQPPFFLIWTSQNNVVLATVRGEIQEGGARGSFIINNNTATSINHSVIVEPSHTNPN